jgi:hypothetical protein
MPNAATTPDPPKPRKTRLALTGGPVRFIIATRPSIIDYVFFAAPAACALVVILLTTLGPLKLLPLAFGRFMLTSSCFLVPASIVSIPVAGIRLATGKWPAAGKVWMTIVLVAGSIATIFLLYAYYAFNRMWR